MTNIRKEKLIWRKKLFKKQNRKKILYFYTYSLYTKQKKNKLKYIYLRYKMIIEVNESKYGSAAAS